MEEFTENLNLTETETETNDEDVEDGRATEQDPDDWPPDELVLMEHGSLTDVNVVVGSCLSVTR